VPVSSAANSWWQHVHTTSTSHGQNWQRNLLLRDEAQLHSVPQRVTGTALRVLVNFFSGMEWH
jgi:hypothetical protein